MRIVEQVRCGGLTWFDAYRYKRDKIQERMLNLQIWKIEEYLWKIEEYFRYIPVLPLSGNSTFLQK